MCYTICMTRNFLFQGFAPSKEEQAKWRKAHPKTKLICSAKARAKRDGIEFSISIKDFKVPKNCPLLGIRLTNIVGKGRLPSNISLDRIDNTKGYIKGNVWVVSDLANRMKQNATSEQLKQFAKNILNRF